VWYTVTEVQENNEAEANSEQRDGTKVKGERIEEGICKEGPVGAAKTMKRM
jgi:hypothetical protein